jgi:membrane fusion protein (multidrug efflux system)
MPNKNGTQSVADEKQAITVVDHEACGSQSGEVPGKHSMTRRKKILVISAAVVITAAATYFAWNAFHYEDTDNAQVHGHVIPLSARINGHIKDVYVSEGQIVHAGEALVSIDPQDYTLAVELAQVDVSEGLFTAGSSHRNVLADAELS